MVFSSVIFLFLFLPLVLSVYYLVRKKYRNFTLLAFSLLFYFWGEGKYVVILCAYMVCNYFFGLAIERAKSKETAVGDKKAKLALAVALAFNLSLLVFFKYFNFLVDNFNGIFAFSGVSLSVKKIHLPIGISFFSFQAMSYVIDIYRRDVKAQKNLINFSMYKALFPQLIAGPIVRYRDVASQVDERSESLDKFLRGLRRFILGLGKKVLIANTVATVADGAFGAKLSECSTGLAWLGVVCYALQIYFDFSGYSDMAIGLGKMFGFDFLENFNFPYISRSIREFWRRWHMSLSFWFRDYLYIPLGGSRAGASRLYLNQLVVFFLCGLWHGASWTFIAWGLWHGAFLVLERTRFGKLLDRVPRPLQHAYAVLVVLIGWVLFRADTLPLAIAYLKAMFFLSSGTIPAVEYLNTKIVLAILAGLIGCTPIAAGLVARAKESVVGQAFARRGLALASSLFLVAVFLGSIILVSTNTYNPFIYFRF